MSDVTAALERALAAAGLDEDGLVALARAARDRAYAPYSGFAVGAVVLAGDGRTFVGANVENAAWSPSICAERVAVPQAVVAGAGEALVALAVAGGGEVPVWPCGVCRQVLVEFAPALVVLGAGATGGHERRILVPELLPDAFGPHALSVLPGPAAVGPDAI